MVMAGFRVEVEAAGDVEGVERGAGVNAGGRVEAFRE